MRAIRSYPFRGVVTAFTLCLILLAGSSSGAPQDKSPDPKVEAAIRRAIELSTPCFAARDPHNIRMFYLHLDWAEHGTAVSLVLMHLYDHKCPVSREVYSLLKMAGTALEVDREEWEKVRPQVVSSRQAALILSRLDRATETAKARIRVRPPSDQGAPPPSLFAAYLSHKQVFIDAAAQLVLEPKFEEPVEDFSDGMAKISTSSEPGQNAKYGYIETTGKVRIEPQFEKGVGVSRGDGVCGNEVVVQRAGGLHR